MATVHGGCARDVSMVGAVSGAGTGAFGSGSLSPAPRLLTESVHPTLAVGEGPAHGGVVRRVLHLLLVVVLLAASAVACGDDDDESVTAEVAQLDLDRLAPVASASPPVAAAVADVAADLYRELATGDDDLVFSPHSIAVAMAMARAGARGETLAEMDAVLGFTDVADVDEGMNALDQLLTSRAGTVRRVDDTEAELELVIANAPYGQEGLAFEESYLTTLAEHYGAGMRLVDYVGDAEGARREINAWVADVTRDRIEDLIAEGLLGPLTRLVLVNAVYLLAPWEHPFEPEATAPGPFRTLTGDEVTVDLMALNTTLDYAELDGVRAVELPYAGRELSMLVLVPDDLSALESGLGAELLADVDAAMETRPVNLRLPRFEQRTQAALSPVFRTLGMELAFDPDRADFSGITAEERLFIAEVVHEAFISVDEEGTEAAAATAVVMAATGLPPDLVELTVDRPFVFVLRDVDTGAILFLGRVADPT